MVDFIEAARIQSVRDWLAAQQSPDASIRAQIRVKYGALRTPVAGFLQAFRKRMLADLAQEIKSRAHRSSLREKVRVTGASVVIDHPGAYWVEHGSAPHYPPPSALSAWLARIGKPQSARFRIARSIAKRGTRKHPFVQPAVDHTLERLDQMTNSTWREWFVARSE